MKASEKSRCPINVKPEVKSHFITGSPEASLMPGITDSVAGRTAVLQLLPFSFQPLRDYKSEPASRCFSRGFGLPKTVEE